MLIVASCFIVKIGARFFRCEESARRGRKITDRSYIDRGVARRREMEVLRPSGVEWSMSFLVDCRKLCLIVIGGGARRRIIYYHVCVFSSHSFWTSKSLDVPAGVTQEEGRIGFLIHLLSAAPALIFLARRIQAFISLVDREVEFCVLDLFNRSPPVGHF